jgi:PAS domain-containing protein
VDHNKIVRWIYCRKRAIRDNSGSIVRIEGVSTDVSYLRQAEAIIEKQELQINAVVDNLDMAILIVNRVGKILLINKEAQESNRLSRWE